MPKSIWVTVCFGVRPPPGTKDDVDDVIEEGLAGFSEVDNFLQAGWSRETDLILEKATSSDDGYWVTTGVGFVVPKRAKDDDVETFLEDDLDVGSSIQAALPEGYSMTTGLLVEEWHYQASSPKKAKPAK